MTTQVMAATSAPPRTSESLVALTRYETRRYVSNPLFLGGLALSVVTTVVWLRNPLVDPAGLPGYPALYLGVLGMVVGFRLSQSLQGSAEALDVAPTPAPVRTAAMLLTALVPFTLGVLTLLAILGFQHVAGPWTYGTFSPADRFAVLAGEVAVSALGGPLLGIAVARWVRSVWIAPLLVIFVSVWVVIANGLAATYVNSFPVVLVRMFSPYTYFLTLDRHPRGVETWRGSPGFFLGWQLCLCALAVVVALLRDATPPLRRRLVRVLVILVPLMVAMYLLAAAGGLGHALLRHPDGSVSRL